MLPTEPREQDVCVTANRQQMIDMDPVFGALPHAAARAGVELSAKRQREAALQRNGRLRTIQALHRPGK